MALLVLLTTRTQPPATEGVEEPAGTPAERERKAEAAAAAVAFALAQEQSRRKLGLEQKNPANGCSLVGCSNSIKGLEDGEDEYQRYHRRENLCSKNRGPASQAGQS